jgi:peptidyl-prolyl cis-trans isomerase SurA
MRRLGRFCAVLGAFALIAASSLQTPNAWAQSNLLRIAAVVNDDIISVLDLEQRLRLVALSSGLQLTQDVRQRLLPQVLRSMIDERLQYQEATANGITVTDRELAQEITNLAERNNIPVPQFPRFLESQGIGIETLRWQLRAQIAWAKYAGRRLSRQVEVGQEEIDEELERLRAVADEPRKRVYEIFLNIDNPDEASQVAQDAQRLLNQIRGGADFRSIARSFSESGSANQGGDLGWIGPGQLPPDLDEAVAELEPGEISEPIRSVTGFYLLYVTDEQRVGRNPGGTSIDLVQLTQRLSSDMGEEARASIRNELQAARGGLSGCEELTRYGENRPGASVAVADGVQIGDLPQAVQNAVSDLQAGQISEPVENGGALVMIGVCARDDPGVALPSREEIEQRIGTEKLELVVRRTMRDLRRSAFIDIRL